MQSSWQPTGFSNAQHNLFLQQTKFAPNSQNNFFEAGNKPSFASVMANVTKDMNATLEQPNDLMKRALTTGDVDVHEVMIAVAKADMSVNVSTQVLTKIIQAYERVQQIQV